MNGSTLFAIGTLASWVGWIALLRATYLGLRLVARPAGLDRDGTQRGLLIAGGLAVAGFLIALAMPMDLKGQPDGWRLPLVWFVMPISMWIATGAIAMSVARGVQAWMAITERERVERLQAMAAWAAAGAIALVFFLRSEGEVEILRGGIPLSPTVGAALIAMLLAGATAMALAARSTQSRGWAKASITHAVLLVGCAVFGLPFAWLLLTSFKEDRDIQSAEGLVWVPKVSKTVQYMDPREPMWEGMYEGTRVQGVAETTLPDGRLQIDVLRPANLRGATLIAATTELKQVPKEVPVVTGKYQGRPVTGIVIQELEGGNRRVKITEPASLKGIEFEGLNADFEPVRSVGLNWQNYPRSLEFLPVETNFGLVYLRNSLILVVMSVIGTLFSSAIVAYAFSRMRFPGRERLFAVLLATMMLPGAVTLLPTFLIFRSLGWIDTLYPLWVPAFFAGAFNVFLLRQFFMSIPMELEDAAKIDGCNYWTTFLRVMVPQIKPALAVIAIWTFMGAWNNFMGPLIYINSPENMPVAYAVQLFQSDRGGELGLMMAFATMAMMPVLLLFFFAQRYFIEGVTLQGLGGR